MKIFGVLLFVLLFVPAVFAQSGQSEVPKLTLPEAKKILKEYDVATAKMSQAHSAVKSGGKAGEKPTCFQECLAKDSCGPRPPTPNTLDEVVKASEVFIWVTCVAGEMAGCKAGCSGL